MVVRFRKGYELLCQFWRYHSSRRHDEMPEAPAFDVDQFRRRRREHVLAARLEQLGRSNAQAWHDQAAMVRGMGWGR